MDYKHKVVLVGTCSPIIGGVSTHIENLARRLRQDGHRVAILDVINEDPTRNDVFRGSSISSFLFNLFGLIFEGYEVFHFHTSKRAYPYFLALFFLLISGRIKVISVHHGNFMEWVTENILREKIYGKLLLLSDSLIFMNDNTREKFIRNYYNSKKIQAVSPFIVSDEELYNKEYSYSNNNNVLEVVTMGLWQPHYRYEDTIKACGIVSKKNCQPVDLEVVVGTTSMNKSYKRKIEKSIKRKSSDLFSITIIEDKDEILTYLEKKDVLVRSSTVDSFGLCVAEALLVGTPAIATNVCDRPSNAKTYSPRNIKKLVELMNLINNGNDRRDQKTTLLTKEDDSYFELINIYENLIKGYLK